MTSDCHFWSLQCQELANHDGFNCLKCILPKIKLEMNKRYFQNFPTLRQVINTLSTLPFSTSRNHLFGCCLPLYKTTNYFRAISVSSFGGLISHHVFFKNFSHVLPYTSMHMLPSFTPSSEPLSLLSSSLSLSL